MQLLYSGNEEGFLFFIIITIFPQYSGPHTTSLLCYTGGKRGSPHDFTPMLIIQGRKRVPSRFDSCVNYTGGPLTGMKEHTYPLCSFSPVWWE